MEMKNYQQMLKLSTFSWDSRTVSGLVVKGS